jgi:hypothetical protein
MIRSALVAAVVVLTTIAPLRAHEEFRVIGTLTKIEATRLQMTRGDGSVARIWVTTATDITDATQDDKKVSSGALKVGQVLVVDAYGDTEDDGEALRIRIVPPITPARR